MGLIIEILLIFLNPRIFSGLLPSILLDYVLAKWSLETNSLETVPIKLVSARMAFSFASFNISLLIVSVWPKSWHIADDPVNSIKMNIDDLICKNDEQFYYTILTMIRGHEVMSLKHHLRHWGYCFYYFILSSICF